MSVCLFQDSYPSAHESLIIGITDALYHPLTFAFFMYQLLLCNKHTKASWFKMLINFPFSFFFLSFCFLGPHLWPMEVLRPGVTLELQVPAYTTAKATQDLSSICDLHHSWWQCWTLNPLSETRDQTCILRDASWVHNPLSHNGNLLKCY